MGPGLDEVGRKRRRVHWPVVAAVALIAVTVLGAWARTVWLPGYRPGLHAGERYGVDVSSHQGTIDWGRVASDDIDFAYIKASEGGDFVDERFRENWAGAAAAGLDHGAYHFFTLCRSGADQAANFLRALPADPGALPPAVDLELAGNCSERPDQASLRRELDTFLDRVERATGQTAVLYVGADFEGLYQVQDDLDRPLWHRRVLRRPDFAGWWIWQAQDHASVDGIHGDVDLNVMRAKAPQR
ncbi:MAG TPA: GH25 family lysozyme [Acidimicrobiales bacterium]